MDTSTATPQTKPQPQAAPGTPSLRITVTLGGPYIAEGGIPLVEETITPIEGHLEYRTTRTYSLQQTYALCRCGHTTTPPFCDGTHAAELFEGEEVASRAPFEERAEIYPGSGVTLFDDGRCSFARFCHREHGDVWTLTQRSDDEELKREAVKASSDCPSGRLVHVDTKEGSMYEPRRAPSIAILQDPQRAASGPLFVRGGVPLFGTDGAEYELRNRYTLCRCGASRDTPFCDAMHIPTAFRDGTFE